MENISLRSIKNESIKKIFGCITSEEKISRAEISERTGLSLMTVGKVVDALLDINIVNQKKETKNAAGRKAGLVSLNPLHYAVVIDLSENMFTMSLIDISLGLVDSMRYTYNNNVYYDENLYMFFKNVSAYLKNRSDIENMIGIGITIPGIYISAEDKIISTKVPELNTINIKKTAEALIGFPVSLIIKNVEAAAISNIRALPNYNDRVIIYMYMGQCVDGAVYNRGSFAKGSHEFECDFGRMIMRYGMTLEERIQEIMQNGMSPKDIEHGFRDADIGMADELSIAVYNIITILDPDAFIIESELPREPDFLIDCIKRSLTDQFRLPEARLPEFLAGTSTVRHSARGVVIHLRDRWLDSII